MKYIRIAVSLISLAICAVCIFNMYYYRKAYKVLFMMQDNNYYRMNLNSTMLDMVGNDSIYYYKNKFDSASIEFDKLELIFDSLSAKRIKLTQ